MSGIYILKNVYNFAQILNLAASNHLRKWDLSTLQKALSWAEYCEELCQHVQQQGCDNEFNVKILQLTTVLTPVSLLRLNLDCLKEATKLLAEIILTNRHLLPNLKTNLEHVLERSVWQEVNRKIKTNHAPCNGLDEIFSICWIQNVAECQNYKDVDSSKYAEILLTSLLSTMKSAEILSRFEQYCSSLCDRLVDVEKGWEVLICIFSISDECLCDPGKDALLSIVLSWMAHQTQEYHLCPTLELDKNLLATASSCSAGFLTFYLSSLMNWSKKFQPYIDGSCAEVWRDSKGNGSAQLSQHFQVLMEKSECSSSKDDLKLTVLSFLCDSIKNSDFSVWREVGSVLLYRQLQS